MSILEATIPIGLGDLIYLKAMFDAAKSNFQQIKIAYHRELITVFKSNNSEYNTLLDDFGKLFFSESPYLLTENCGPFRGVMRISTDYRIPLRKPELGYLLCKGTPLNLDEPYIVLTTKVRYLSRTNFNEKAAEFWDIIKQLSKKYKFIVLGERVVNEHRICSSHLRAYIWYL